MYKARTRWPSRLVLIVTVACTLAGGAAAGDGVVEVNQAKVEAGGVTAGDLPGFPVTISESGSYRFVSDLVAPQNSDGVQIMADEVTVDLNGFSLISEGGTLFLDGISVGSNNVELRGGTIRGFARHGVGTNLTVTGLRVVGVRAIGNTFSGFDMQGPAGLVTECSAINNGSNGIRVGDGSLVINSVARGNGGFGLVLELGAGYRSNVLTENNGGNANPQVSIASGGFELGANICGTNPACP